MICLDSALFPKKFLCKSHVAKNLPDLITQWPTVEFEPLYIPAAFNAISEWEYLKKESMCISFLISMICLLENVYFIHYG